MRNFLEKLKKIKPATLIRTAALVIALANQLCNQLGFVELPDSLQEWYTHISWILTTLTGLTAWWKNNSFTDAAIKADEMLGEIRQDCGETQITETYGHTDSAAQEGDEETQDNLA